jgi:serine/threonine protein kinase
MDTLHAISHAPAPPLTLAGSHAPVHERDDLQRILDKCLAKDPAARYQTSRDLVVDLRDARRRLDSSPGVPSGSTPAASAPRPARGLRSMALWATPIVLAAAVGAYWWTHRAPPPPPPMATSGRPSVAVLYFQNNTGSPQLDWLRTGLTDMVVTDLSQSPGMDVLSTDRLYRSCVDEASERR